MHTPSKGFFRLSPGNEVRLRHAFIIKCERLETDADGQITTLYCRYDPDTKSGSGGRNVKGNIHWVSAADGIKAKARLYDRLFTIEDPDSGGDYQTHLNPNSVLERDIWLEPSIEQLPTHEAVQFERVGYFIADRKSDCRPVRVFNRAVDLKKAKF
jgi:glutaminyl-tRNA synthetase